MANDSAVDINVGIALSTALLLPGDLDRNAELSEYENYALMLQRSVQSFENRQKLVDMKKEFFSLQKTNKGLQSKLKKLEDQAEAAIKAQTEAEEKVDSTEAIRKVVESQRKEADEKMAQAEKELQEALVTKDAEIKEADEKAYAQGMADVMEAYEIQVKQEGDEVPIEVVPENAPADISSADKSVEETLQEIDAEIAADKAAEMFSQQASDLQIQPTDGEES
ncbi:tropomyosin beta chain-like [Camellia sinensis]|uniref:tropomyosin beta chain-like n=1 Tax=Camellia sinensis TaxID=4442 RepID=UPI001035BCEB|nr:tropomyosin beta chain-like [Camellia sinensis]